MYVISKKAALAFREGYEFKLDNTKVEIEDTIVIFYLYNKPIAWRFLDNDQLLYLTLAGYNTRTTKNRLNAILSVYYVAGKFRTIKGKPTFVNEEIDSDNIIILNLYDKEHYMLKVENLEFSSPIDFA